MAGQLTISTLSDGTNSTSSTNCIQGSAKAWVNFNGTNGSVRASYNISSVTRTATGTYTIVMTNAMSDANYSLTYGAGGRTSIPGDQSGISMYNTPTSSTFYLVTNNATTTITDVPYVYAAVFR